MFGRTKSCPVSFGCCFAVGGSTFIQLISFSPPETTYQAVWIDFFLQVTVL